jgi:signal transduction histidine kinase
MVFIVLVMITTTITALMQARSWYSETRAGLARVHEEKASRAASVLAAYFDEIENQLRLSSSLSYGSDDLTRKREDFHRLLRSMPTVTSVQYLDWMGREQLFISRLELNRLRSDLDLSGSDAFQSAYALPTYFSPVRFAGDSEPYMTASQAESGPRGGVTVIEVNLKSVGETISSIPLSSAGSIYIVDDTGRLIAHRDMGLALRGMDWSGMPQVADALTNRKTAARAGNRVVEGRDLNKREVLTAYEYVEQRPGWIVFVEQPLDEALAPIYSSVARSALILAGGLVASIAASLLLARRMVTPIRALRSGAARLGTGDLDERIHISTGDELEELADDFNRMADRLQDLYSGLERRVAERTSELAGTLQELEVRTRELEVASRHKSEFLASMSHELRTPLNSVIGFADVLLEKMFGPLNEKQVEYLVDIRTSGQHLLSLINDILDLSKVEAGHLELEVSEFWLPEALENTMTMFRETALRRGITTQLTLASDLGLIQADLRRVRQVLFNLLSNALKFTEPGGLVELRATQDGTTATIEVRDTGVGIDLADQERIFEAFQQSHSGVRAQEGTGLGLTLVKRLIELHGGRVSLTSASGQGSTFVVTIPLQQPGEAAGNPGDDTSASIYSASLSKVF